MQASVPPWFAPSYTYEYDVAEPLPPALAAALALRMHPFVLDAVPVFGIFTRHQVPPFALFAACWRVDEEAAAKGVAALYKADKKGFTPWLTIMRETRAHLRPCDDGTSFYMVQLENRKRYVIEAEGSVVIAVRSLQTGKSVATAPVAAFAGMGLVAAGGQVMIGTVTCSIVGAATSIGSTIPFVASV